jgi:hypothetical protein
MGRDKLITVRIEQDLRDAFNRWTKDKGTDASSVLYDFIKRCLDGSIDANLATGKTIISLYDSRLDAIIENRLIGVREEMTAAIESLRSEFAPALELVEK